MIKALLRLFKPLPASPYPPLPNAHLLGVHIAEATRKAGRH